jgi:hypothetical protein
MKENTINIRTSEEDKAELKQAAENLSILTEEKPSISKAIRAGVRILAEQDPNKPELFFVNRQALRDLEGHLDYALKNLQAIYDMYLKILGAPPTMEEITSWYGTARSNFMVANNELIREGIVNKKYIEQRGMYPGLQFGPDNVILPDLDELYEVCGRLIFVPGIEYKEYFFWQCYQIVEDKVEIIPEAVETVKNRWRVYAVTPDEKARLATIRKLCAVMDTIKLSNPAQLNIAGFVIYDNEAGVYVPGEYYIKGYVK